MTLRDSLCIWAALRAPIVKPRTREYHQEIIEFIGRNWPEKFNAEAGSITEQDVGIFAGRIGRLSDSRYNGLVTMLKPSLPAAKNLRRRKARIKERRILNQLEFRRLLDELDLRPRSHASLVVRLLAHTGLRIEEARRIKWENVQADFLLVPSSASKSGLPRIIPFVNGARKTLKALKSIAGDSGAVIPQAECKRSLGTACKLAGLPRQSHHSFRHLFATRCLESGVDLATLARWLGHQDGGALLSRTYFHLLDEHSRRMAGKVRI